MNMLYGIAMTAAGIICFIIGRNTLKTARASKKWPAVQGKITSSGTAQMNTLQGGPAYAASVKYEYEVDGKKYNADRISMGQYGTGGGGHAKAEAAKYPAGKTVAVHYDPQNPSQAVLEPGGAVFTSVFLLFFAVILAPVGLLFLIASLV